MDPASAVGDQVGGVGRYTHLLAQGLFELGHTVHVVTHGKRDQVTFRDGAYVHQTPYGLKRYPRYQALPNLHHALNYSHAVHDQVERLVLNDDVEVAASPIWQFDGLVTAKAGLIPVVVHPVTALRQIGELQGQTDLDTQLVGDMEQSLIEHAAFIAANSQATCCRGCLSCRRAQHTNARAALRHSAGRRRGDATLRCR